MEYIYYFQDESIHKVSFMPETTGLLYSFIITFRL